MAPFHDLLSNLAVVALATSLWTCGQRHVPRGPAWLKSVCFGVLMSAGTAAVMALPFEFRHGVYLDLRYSFIAISALFGGPIASILCVATAALMRIVSGGDGLTTGLALTALVWLSGLVAWRVNRLQIPDLSLLLGLSFAVALSGVSGFFFKLPWEQWPAVMPAVVAPYALVLFTATATASIAVAQEMRRQRTTEENRVYRAIIEALPDCLNAKDLRGRFIAANPATAELMNAPSAEHLIGRTDFDYYAEDVAGMFALDEQRLREGDQPVIVEQKFVRADGRDAWLLTLKSPLRDESGALIGIVTHNREITQQKLLERELVRAQSRLSDAVSSMADGLAMFDADGIQIFHNLRYLEMFPATADLRVDGASLQSILAAGVERGEEDPHGVEVGEYAAESARTKLMQGDRQFKLADGRWIETRTRATSEHGYLILFSDVSETNGTQEELKALALTDALTGVANRRAFDEQLVRTLSLPIVDCCLLMVDIDHFKTFNDTYGHLEGDVCLRAVAACLEQVTSSHPGRVVARYGGEEFAVILPQCDAVSGEAVAGQVLRGIRELAIFHDASPVGVVTVSVGVALASAGGDTPADLIRRADKALYEAKAAGRNGVSLYAPHYYRCDGNAA